MSIPFFQLATGSAEILAPPHIALLPDDLLLGLCLGALSGFSFSVFCFGALSGFSFSAFCLGALSGFLLGLLLGCIVGLLLLGLLLRLRDARGRAAGLRSLGRV